MNKIEKGEKGGKQVDKIWKGWVKQIGIWKHGEKQKVDRRERVRRCHMHKAKTTSKVEAQTSQLMNLINLTTYVFFFTTKPSSKSSLQICLGSLHYLLLIT